MDSSALARFGARMVDQLDEEFAEDEDAFVRSFALVVEIDAPGWDGSQFRVGANDDREWVRVALLQEGVGAVLDEHLPTEDDEE
jgi:hypothetical protein